MKITKTQFKRKGSTPAAAFEQHGDGVEGQIVDMQDVEDTFNKGEEVFRIDGYGTATADGVESEGPWVFYCRSAGQCDAMADASPEDGIEIGGHLEIRYSDDKPLRGGKVLKLYTASYTPPQLIGSGE